MNHLSPSQSATCGYFGTFGMLTALVCLIQLFSITIPHWITAIIAIFYALSILAFALLAARRPAAPFLLIISCVTCFLTEAVLILSGLFSLIVLIHCIYILVVTIYLFMEGYPKKLKERALAIRQEEAAWAGKI